MKSFLSRTFVMGIVLGVGASALADSRTDEVWTCQIKDGKTMDDVRATNSKWVKLINAAVDGGDITSNIVTPVVGNAEEGYFLYVDSFPSLESWAAAKSALDDTKEGDAIQAALAEVAECSDNRLYSSEPS